LTRVRLAITRGDRDAALDLLRDVAEGKLDEESLAGVVGDALVATARGPKQSEGDRKALGRLEQIDRARAQIIHSLAQTAFGPADLSAIRSALEARESAMRVTTESDLNRDLVDDNAGMDHRVGSVWLEVKYIRDPVSGRQYGPYLYGRWREGARKRSRYIGKARPS
jgi:hypothetical protein